MAQIPQATPNFGSNGFYREDAASRLARYLRVITSNPRDLEALTGAGRAALDVGDAQAAIGFYARAEAISPRNGRVKAGLGSALVLLNQEQAALRYFDDAIQLGVPEAEIASDRGLAHDLRGSAKRAQRDYAVALARGENAEATRRMALSLAIGGERDAALALLDPLLRRQDTAAWRARAFILAMTGDTAGASRAAESVMSASMAAGFVPFFRKLPSLRPGEKAAAVHFGNFPGEGRPMRIDDLFNQAEVAARVALENTPRSPTDGGRVDASQSALGQSALGQSALGQSAFGQSAFVRANPRIDNEGQVSARPAPRPIEQRIAAASTPRPNAIVPAIRPTPRSVPVANVPTATISVPTAAPATNTQSAIRAPAATTAPAASQPVAVATSLVPARPPTPTGAPTSLLPVALAAADAPIRPPTPVAPLPAASSATPTSTPTPTPTPGFGNAAPLASPVRSPASSPAAPPAVRLADISATVREAVREPTVRSVDLPASSSPAASGLPVASPPFASPASITPTVTAAIAAAPAVPPPRAADAAPIVTNVVPPAPRPKVETAMTTAATLSAPPVSRPRVETAGVVPPLASGPRVETTGSAPGATSPGVTRAAASTDASRVWVQVAGGADAQAFDDEWRKLRGKAPELLGEQTAWMTPLRATNRLLVGPFDNGRAAQNFVNKLGLKGITAFAWTSAQGQTIAKLATR